MSRTKHYRGVAKTVEAATLLALPILTHYLFPLIIIVSKPYSYLGVAVMLLGLALATWASMTFRRVGTGFQLQRESPALATSGPFRISRNPMYLGMLLWLVGLAVLLGSLTAFLFPLLLFLVSNFGLIPIEEKNMEEMFGE